jgi:hypothetical protein
MPRKQRIEERIDRMVEPAATHPTCMLLRFSSPAGKRWKKAGNC